MPDPGSAGWRASREAAPPIADGNRPDVERRASQRRVSLALDEPQGGAATALDRIRLWALLSLLAWAPLPLGSARPWAWSLLGVLASVLLLLSGLGELMRPGEKASLVQLRWPMIMGAVLVAWALLQVLPAVPAAWHHPLWDKAAEMLGRADQPSISIDRETSIVYLFRLLTYAAVFLVAWQAAQRGQGAALLLRALAAIGAGYALYGLVEFASPTPHILWFRKWAYAGSLTSTFVNRNSYATFAGLTLIAALVPLAETLMRHIDGRSRRSLARSTLEALLSQGKYAAAAALLLGSAVLLSRSRGGTLATLSGLTAFLVLIRTAPTLAGSWRAPFGLIASTGALIGLISAGASLLQRITDTPLNGRWPMFIPTFSAIRDNFVFGIGLGNFRYVYPMYQSPEFVGYVDLAHNDYLQNMLELGVPGALLFFALIGYLAFECFRGIRRRRKDALYPCAALAATVLVAVHSSVDFSLQIPAVSVTYAAILGIGVAQSVSSRQRGLIASPDA
jgi:O-antigen ligase